MQNPKSISELLKGGKHVSQLRSRSVARVALLEKVRLLLPAELRSYVVSAGLEGGRLTLGVTTAVWASRVRYLVPALLRDLKTKEKQPVTSYRVRVLPPGKES